MENTNIAEIIKIKQKRLQDAVHDVRELTMLSESMMDADFDIPQLEELKRLYFPNKQLGEKTIRRSARIQCRSFLDSLAQTYIQVFALQREGLALWPYHWLFSKNEEIPRDFYNQYLESQCQRINQSYDLSTYNVAEVQRNGINTTELVQLLNDSANFDHVDYLKSRITSEYDFRCFSGLFFEQTFETLMSQIEIHLIIQKINLAALLCVRDRRHKLGQNFNARAHRSAGDSFDTSDRACASYGKNLHRRLQNFKPLFANAADSIEGYKQATDAMQHCKPPFREKSPHLKALML